MRLIAYLWKGVFKTKILIKVILSCNDYLRNYRVRKKVFSATSVSEMRKNFGKLCKKKKMFNQFDW